MAAICWFIGSATLCYAYAAYVILCAIALTPWSKLGADMHLKEKIAESSSHIVKGSSHEWQRSEKASLSDARLPTLQWPPATHSTWTVESL